MDLEILEKRFDVKKMNVATFLVPRRGRDPLVFLRLLKGILWADAVYTWFADINAFFIVLFCIFLRKKSIIVVGGYDVVYIPEIDYGTLNSFKNSLRVKFMMKYATKILPFSNYAKNRVLSVTKKANLCVMPLACNTEKFKSIHGKKENLVITVCYVDKSNIARKGLKTFVESAKFLPKIEFALIGRHVDDSVNYLKKMSPPNVEFPGYVSEEELIGWYQRAKVYCQLSYQEGEGAGGALGEAMACECVPVVSSKAVALRETVGDCGFYVPYGDAEATVEAIKTALRAPSELGAKGRERMKDLFSMEKRENRLLQLINGVLNLHA
jgi:glycosyltransferase involved in cell wall biosynthesis